jgi:hypothetical protein
MSHRVPSTSTRMFDAPPLIPLSVNICLIAQYGVSPSSAYRRFQVHEWF